MITRTPPLAVALAFSALLAGCATSEASDDIAVGTVLGTDAVIGRVSDGEKVTFYVCGGATTYSTMTRWLSGPDDASGAVSLEKDGWRVVSDPGGHSGRIIPPDGPALAFEGHAAGFGTAEGLYGVVDSGCRTGAVVLDAPGGGAPRVQGAWCGSDGAKFAQVIPILPGDISSGGIAVRVNVDGIRKDLFVVPLSIASLQ
ncbi:MAG: hypothetical protein ABJE95_34470 [Byssovorax sp.]